MNILVIGEDPSELEKIKMLLTGRQYSVETAAGPGKELPEKTWYSSYDLILLDIMPPGMSGLDLLVELRKSGIGCPVLLLTAKGNAQVNVKGLDLGADDCLAKPFSPDELLARVRALLRRGVSRFPVIKVGNINLNVFNHEVTKAGEPLLLTAREFALLEFLLHNRGREVSRFNLAEHVWGYKFNTAGMSNFIDVHIKNLRQKLMTEGEESLIKTIRGFGYLIDKEGE